MLAERCILRVRGVWGAEGPPRRRVGRAQHGYAPLWCVQHSTHACMRSHQQAHRPLLLLQCLTLCFQGSHCAPQLPQCQDLFLLPAFLLSFHQKVHLALEVLCRSLELSQFLHSRSFEAVLLCCRNFSRASKRWNLCSACSVCSNRVSIGSRLSPQSLERPEHSIGWHEAERTGLEITQKLKRCINK